MMSLIPAFEIGVWNAWILSLLVFVTLFTPNLFLNKEGKRRNKRLEGFVTSNRIEKALVWSTHLVIWPFVIIYSIFLPLKLGTVWLYAGLPIFAIALAMQVIITISVSNTPLDNPVTKGAYRISRHPIYFSGFLIFVGISIASASWVILLCALLWIVFLNAAARNEEHFLVEQHGDVYRDYMKRTPRWIGIPKPGVSK
jgi:protein-S-isoprenylcysteine O-methyltransferase Ste14